MCIRYNLEQVIVKIVRLTASAIRETALPKLITSSQTPWPTTIVIITHSQQRTCSYLYHKANPANVERQILIIVVP